MRILVVGGTRFIGPYVVRELHAGGHEVGVFHRGRTSGALPEGTHEILADRQALRDRRSGEVAALRAFAPAVVVDMIAMTKADAEATVATFAGVAERLVVASSMDVYRPYSRLHREEDG
ncbi:MAG: NAD-dependent epimerase/dehydratase family protein, partial [Dehalococcoidia bacterium]